MIKGDPWKGGLKFQKLASLRELFEVLGESSFMGPTSMGPPLKFPSLT